jgi:hypothetical protein
MFKNPRYTEDGGVLVEQDNGIDLYVFDGDVYQQAKQGAFGPVAEYLPPPAPTPEQLEAQAREKRNTLLAESDWTQLPDARAAMGAEKAAEWDTYRQALRDITDQPGFPEEINWPVKPQ